MAYPRWVRLSEENLRQNKRTINGRLVMRYKRHIGRRRTFRPPFTLLLLVVHSPTQKTQEIPVKPFAATSDYLQHDTTAVSVFQTEVAKVVRQELSEVRKIHYYLLLHNAIKKELCQPLPSQSWLHQPQKLNGIATSCSRSDTMAIAECWSGWQQGWVFNSHLKTR